MKEQILQRLKAIPETDYASLMMVVSSLTENIKAYFYLGIDEAYQKTLMEFRMHSQRLLNACESPVTYQKDDIYWLLYWATSDTSLQSTYNGYNYLHLLLEPSVKKLVPEINLKEYVICIVQLIKPENLTVKSILI